MNDPQSLAAQLWEHAEALIEHCEMAVRAGQPPERLLDEMVTRLRTATGAQAVSLLVNDDQGLRTLVRSGIAITTADDVQHDSNTSIDATRDLVPDMSLQLSLSFAQPVSLSARKPLVELTQTLLDLATSLYLRITVAELKSAQQLSADRDQWIAGLYQGQTLHESLSAIAASIAGATNVDRVNLVRLQGNRARWVGTSNRTHVDPRAAQVRALEQLVSDTGATAEGSTFHATSTELPPAVRSYFAQSACQALRLDWVGDGNVAIVSELFRPAQNSDELARALQPIREPIELAVAAACKRDDTDWGQLVRGTANLMRRANFARLALAAGLAVLAAIVIPVPLRLAVDGRIAAVKSSRIYAPAEAVVTEVLVADGQRVEAGTPLVRLRSPQLDLQQKTIEGLLATARSRFDSLQVARTNPRRTGDRATNPAADEKMLATEIEGLETQLRLVQGQQDALLVTSPISGQVDRWDLHNSLAARPVAVGQLLLNVVSTESGWQVNLAIPDQSAGYVLRQQQQQPCLLTARLRSDPTVVQQSELDTIAASAQLDQSGHSIVWATASLKSDSSSSFRDGATVVAQIHCGNYPIGFVWLRGLFEWWRTSAWF